MSVFAMPPTAIDALSYEEARQVLMDLSRTDAPTLTMISDSIVDEPIYVVDTMSELGAGRFDDALKGYARSNGLEVSSPLWVPNPSDASSGHFEVQMSHEGSFLQSLSSGKTEKECLQGMRQALQDLAGDRVLPLAQWAAMTMNVLAENNQTGAIKTPKEKLPQFVTVEHVELQPLPVATSKTRAQDELKNRKERRKAAYESLAEPFGMTNRLQSHLIRPMTGFDWSIRVIKDGEKTYANHHDMLEALRLGLDVTAVLPWPNDVAHRFLVQKELKLAMRSRGFVELVDYDPADRVKLYGALPDFSPEITGDKPYEPEYNPDVEKAPWPPVEFTKQRVVIVLDHARLALEWEPEYERIGKRDIFVFANRYWVESDGTFEPIRKKQTAKKKAASAKRKN